MTIDLFADVSDDLQRPVNMLDRARFHLVEIEFGGHQKILQFSQELRGGGHQAGMVAVDAPARGHGGEELSTAVTDEPRASAISVRDPGLFCW
jgi:hypothetical protein